MATRPPGARHLGKARSSPSSAENSSFTAMRSAWKHAANRHLHLGLVQIGAGRGEPQPHHAIERVRGGDGLLLQQAGDELSVRLVGVLAQQISELALADAGEQL